MNTSNTNATDTRPLKKAYRPICSLRYWLPLLVTALLLTGLSSRGQVAYSFFQSPEPTPTNTPVPEQPGETPPDEGEETDEGEEGEDPAGEAAPQDNSSDTVPTPIPPSQPSTELDALLGEDQGEVVLNEVTLIDTIVQWFAYIWLCVGVVACLSVPLFFLFLQLRGLRMRR